MGSVVRSQQAEPAPDLASAPRHAAAHARTASPSTRAHARSQPLDLGIGAQKRSRARKLFAHRQRISDVISRLDSADAAQSFGATGKEPNEPGHGHNYS